MEIIISDLWLSFGDLMIGDPDVIATEVTLEIVLLSYFCTAQVFK